MTAVCQLNSNPNTLETRKCPKICLNKTAANNILTGLSEKILALTKIPTKFCCDLIVSLTKCQIPAVANKILSQPHCEATNVCHSPTNRLPIYLMAQLVY